MSNRAANLQNLILRRHPVAGWREIGRMGRYWRYGLR
jgi:hypothetical protein